jgi:hypothetical protein
MERLSREERRTVMVRLTQVRQDTNDIVEVVGRDCSAAVLDGLPCAV